MSKTTYRGSFCYQMQVNEIWLKIGSLQNNSAVGRMRNFFFKKTQLHPQPRES